MSYVVSFPHGDELVQIINDYEQRRGFPMCAGAIDGTHIPIVAPSECHAEYVNRKGYHSIIMQAVVDCKYLYRDVVIGWPGSVHDARVFSNSSIFKKGNEGKLFPDDLTVELQGVEMSPFIVADPAYPLLPWVLTTSYPGYFLLYSVHGHLLRKDPGIVWSRVSQNLGGNNKFLLGWVTK